MAHRAKAEKENSFTEKISDGVRTREQAAARCTEAIKRRVLKKQARKARAGHLVRCSMALGEKKAHRPTLTELTRRRAFYFKKSSGKKNCRGTVKRYTRIRKRRKKNKKRIEYFKMKGDQQFTVEGRNAEITVDLVL